MKALKEKLLVLFEEYGFGEVKTTINSYQLIINKTCPMCKQDSLVYRKGEFTESMGSFAPSISCKCGFSYEKKLSDYEVHGLNLTGWEIIEKQMRMAQRDIAYKFGKFDFIDN